jgi:hypothetical protein
MRSYRPGRAAALLLIGWLCPLPALGADLWTAEDGRSSLELRAFYKHQLGGLRMPGGLVEATERLAGVVAEARASLPAEEAALLPGYGVIPRCGGLSAHGARLWGRMVWLERLELTAGWQLGWLNASDPVLLGGFAFGSSLPVGFERARRRLVDFEPTLAESRESRLSQDLDLLALRLKTSFADFVAGRQVLSWGSGRLWNPTDLLSPFGPAEIDREVRRGVDALRVSVPLAATAQLELLWLPQPEARDHGGVLRSQVNLLGFDVAPSVAKYVRDLVFGLDTAGDLGSFGVHAELAWTRALDLGLDGSRDQFLRAVAGADWRATDRLVVTGEYYYNGWGARDPSGYLQVLRSPRVVRGEVFGAARHYLGLILAWQATELLTVQGITLANVTDPSAELIPALEYWAEQSLLVRAYGSVPLGKPPDPGSLGQLTPEDATLGTDAWRRATRSLGLKSEFGTSPWGLFIQVAAYWL